MLEAGAIVHARTTAPEFSCAGFTQSRLWGVTRNPWNPELRRRRLLGRLRAPRSRRARRRSRSGSDIGGSIRIPASFNGVVGFKPPYGRVPVDPPFNLDTYCHCGPLARTVADCALYENVLAGPDPSDIVVAAPEAACCRRDFEGVEGLRVALSVDLGDWPVDPEVRGQHARGRRGAARRRARSSTRSTCDVPHDRRDAARRRSTSRSGSATGSAPEAAEHPDERHRLRDRRSARWCRGGRATAHSLEGLELEARLYAPVGALLEDYDALVCPTAGTRGLLAGDDYVGHGLEVGGRQLECYFDAACSRRCSTS